MTAARPVAGRLTDLEPAPVDGAALLDDVRGALTRFVVLPSDATTDAVVLWIAATHAQPAWAHAPRLVIRAPEKRCGKSRLLDVIEATCHDPLITVNASPAAVYRAIGTDDPPTLLVDEADTIFGSRKAAEANEDLRGLLNAGHQRNRPAIRYDANTRSVERIPTFAMAALAGIGHMPDTIEDRAVIVRMRRRGRGERVDPFRHRRDRPPLAELRAHVDQLADAIPPMPVEDRAADTWEPLVAVADLAAGAWPDRARLASEVLTAEYDDTGEVATSTTLLTDCRTAFGDAAALPTEELLNRLRQDPEAPWGEFGPSGLTARRLGLMLAEYGIRPAKARYPDGTQRRGFARAGFADAWSRYCPPELDQDAARMVADPDPSQPSQPELPSSARDGSPVWDGSTRPTDPTRPSLTSAGTGGTDGTGQLRGCEHDPRAVCLDCWTRTRRGTT
jgi:Protein of unknown function (DUF3631)